MNIDCGTETVALYLQPLFAGNGEYGFFSIHPKYPHVLRVDTDDVDVSVKRVKKILVEQIKMCQRLLAEAF